MRAVPPSWSTPSSARRFPRLQVAVEPLLLLLACLLALGPTSMLPGDLAIGHPTRDLFDHLALLDHWALSAPEQAFPDGGRLFPPDLSGMLLAAPALALDLPRATAWNLATLAQLWLCCLGAWALGRRYGAGLAAGVAFGLSPYLLGQALTGEAETIAAWPLPVMLLLLEVAADRWRGRATGSPLPALVGAGLLGALGALGAWYYGAFITVYLLAWVAIRAWRSDADGPRRFEPRALVAPAVFALAIAGPAAAYAQVLVADDQLFRGPSMAAYLEHYPRSLAGMVADPAAFFGTGGAGIGHVDNIGVVLVLLAVVGTVRGAVGRESARWWWAVAAAAVVLALGPILHVGGAPVFAWMPYRFLAELPLFGLMRLPHRWMLLVFLGLAVLAARGARGFSWLAAFLLWAEVTWFAVPARPLTDIAPPTVVASIDGPVLDLPPRTIGLDARGRYLVWQRVHRQPVAYTLLMQSLGPTIAAEPLVQAVAGLDSRDPIAEKIVEAEQFRQRELAVAAAAWRNDRGDAEAVRGAADRLRAMGYELVVLHGPLLDPDDAVAIYDLLRAELGPPDEEIDEALLWRL